MNTVGLPMICRCKPGGVREAQRLREAALEHILDGDEMAETWELDSLVLHALDDAGFKIRAVLVDQWFGVSIEHFSGQPSYYVEADLFTDALCALYRAAAIEPQ